MFFNGHVWADDHGYLNAPKGSAVTLGFNVPQSGPYADEGSDELRAYKLAVKHLNGEGDGGMMNTFSSKALTKSMIEKDGVIMVTGGSSSGVAVAVQALCQEAGIIFMAGLTHSNDTTGKDRKANGFRHFFNSYMSGAAVLNHYGGNMINSLTNAVQFGLRDKEVNGKNFEIIVPLYSRLMAKGAGANVKGIFGSTNWHWSLTDDGSKAFVKSFGEEYGFPPSQAAHTTETVRPFTAVRTTSASRTFWL